VLRTLVLGIVQGLTEFLPISSSAHLSIVPKLLGYRTSELAFDVLLHFGTLAAVVLYFARDLWEFVLSLVAPATLGRGQARARRRQLLLLAIASVPAAVFGYLLQNWADAQTSRPLRSAVWLVLTTAIMIGAELWDRGRVARPVTAATATPFAATATPFAATATPAADDPQVQLAPATARPMTRAEVQGQLEIQRQLRQVRLQRPGSAEEELERMPVAKAVGIGLAQALALVPGTSRSGVTISVGLFEGVSREAAARFSFLLSIPAILGAGMLKLGDLGNATETPAQLAVGFLAAAVSGFIAVSFLVRLLRTHTLWPFIWYRLLAGSLFVILLVTVRS
jgi:undecaprenyl-diphosphatase